MISECLLSYLCLDLERGVDRHEQILVKRELDISCSLFSVHAKFQSTSTNI